MFGVLQRLTLSPWTTTQLLVASLFINLLGLASSVYVIQVYGRYLLHGLDGTLITLTLGMAVVVVMEFVLRRLRHRMVVGVSAASERESGEQLFNTLLHASADELMRMRPEMRQMVLRRHEQLQSTLNPTLLIAMVDAPFALLYLTAIFLISTVAGWAVLILLTVTLLMVVAIGLRMRESTQGQIGAQAAQEAVLSSADQFEMVRTTGAAEHLGQAWKARSGDTRWWRYRMGSGQDLLQSITQSMTMVMTVTVIALGAREVVLGQIDFGMLIGINILATRALMLLTRPGQSLAPLLRALQSRKLIENFQRIPLETPQGSELEHYSGTLELKRVRFGYVGGDGPVFEGLTFSVPAGGFVKVVGGNGAGKTTLCRLLNGVLPARQGTILADGVDIRQLNPQWWRRQLVYLPQEPQLLNGTLKENLLLLNPEISEETLSGIIQATGLQPLINNSEAGLEMEVKEGGRNLSLGIRRRIALARAMVADGPLVIIDEPMEGLDSEGIQMMGQLLNQFSQQRRTLIVMTHEARTIQGEAIVVDLNQKPTPAVQQPGQRPFAPSTRPGGAQ